MDTLDNKLNALFDGKVVRKDLLHRIKKGTNVPTFVLEFLIIADASLAFVGNIDKSVDQLVNSAEFDLFQPLPPAFDLAVLDRFACYLPGWEMPKNSTEFLTGNYGFITDYLAEAFHYAFKHTNRYEEVSRRVRLGSAVEGRDEKGIKKTLCALLKILHPAGPPSDDEFDEYATYAIECRRRVKEQMNKRKPDDEFARINLSFITTEGDEIIVYCPESRHAPATQSPTRKTLEETAPRPTGRAARSSRSTTSSDTPAVPPAPPAPPMPPQPTAVDAAPMPVQPVPIPAVAAPLSPELTEQHYTILYGDTGYSYESILGAYLVSANVVTIEDPYIRTNHQIQNFVRFCETIVKWSVVKRIDLVTSYDDSAQLAEFHTRMDELKDSLLDVDVILNVRINTNLHDREIRLDNGWTIKIGRGLDFYQRPEGWFTIGANDLELRKCLETKVDIFKA